MPGHGHEFGQTQTGSFRCHLCGGQAPPPLPKQNPSAFSPPCQAEAGLVSPGCKRPAIRDLRVCADSESRGSSLPRVQETSVWGKDQQRWAQPLRHTPEPLSPGVGHRGAAPSHCRAQGWLQGQAPNRKPEGGRSGADSVHTQAAHTVAPAGRPLFAE